MHWARIVDDEDENEEVLESGAAPAQWPPNEINAGHTDEINETHS